MNKTLIVLILIVVTAGLGLAAASCVALPRLWPVQADETTPTATSTAAEAPTIEIAPAQGGPGTRITVTGRGWRPGDTVFVRLEDPTTGQVPGLDQASAIITDAGDFSVKFTYPFDPRWASLPTVQIIALNPARGQRAATAFTLAENAFPTATPTSLPALTPEPTATTLPTAAPSATATRPAPTATRPIATATHLPTATPVPPTATRPPTATPAPIITDWRGEYFANPNLTGQPAIVRNDWSVDFSWGLGAPAAGIPVDSFSARWTRSLNFQPGTYRFSLAMDDGARLWVDDQLLINDWRDGGARELTAEMALAGGLHNLRVEYYERTGLARVQLRWERLGAVTYPDWQGEYWANLNLAGSPTLTRNDRFLSFQWGNGAPAAGLPADGFSARWTRQVIFAPGVYRLFAQADDGVRVLINGQVVLNEWHDNPGTAPSTVDLPLDGAYTVMVEYYERTGNAQVSFWWQEVALMPTTTNTPTRTPTATATLTPSRTPTVTPSPTATSTGGVTPPTPTATATATPTFTPSPTATPSVTATASLTPSPTHTPSPTETATEEPTATPTHTPSPTAIATEALTAIPSSTATATEEPTATPTHTPSPTATATEEPTATATPSPTSTGEATPPLPTASPTATSTSEGTPPTPTATLRPLAVRINELLPVPEAVDWDGDGGADARDEWIELYNPTRRAVDLSGWRLEVAGRPTTVFRLPRRTVIPAGGYLVFYQRQSGLALPDGGGQMRLLDARGRQVDLVRYPALAPDASYSYASPDAWTADWPPSPGKPNLPAAPASRPTATAEP